MMGMFDDLIKGKTEMSQMTKFLGGMDGGFWKGAVVGAALALLISSPMVTDTIAGMFSGLMGGGQETGSPAPEKGKEA